ncbi:hypothetical protein [Alkalihalobacillus trypoxylicola]|uniref:Uncharacterized protein n=1 Tax=Alkalihalobacillus trypoxylicola TaxID=519424 RepID=A0A161QN85_9BACI|nr:hypothetical protein [Alkalihalobacillus trypoxylicola]KYG31813.1 hypothetical protein AZF04_03270 [Alkalihalobacillus trypoxylicola]
MSICPVCNGFVKVNNICSACSQAELIDYGRISDYEDKYSAYEEIEIKKINNQLSHDAEMKQCAHFLYCPECKKTSMILINEN